MFEQTPVLRVAVFAPLRRIFHYRLEPGLADFPLQAGLRVRVPFGKGQRYGIILGLARSEETGPEQLKPVTEILDHAPCLPDTMQALLEFSAQYYQHPLGEVWATALPVLLRKGSPLPDPPTVWILTPSGRERLATRLKRSPRQRALLELLAAQTASPEDQLALALGKGWRALARQCRDNGWIAAQTPRWPAVEVPPSPFRLSDEQQAALDAITQSKGFAVHLLDGVTGSGKTLVYLEAIAPVLAAGKQALVLVPDISLTPQLLARFTDRFGAARVAALHSGLSDHQRLSIWDRARRGDIAVLIGTRSALFTPLARPGMLVIDEEHDPSLKQQDGLRYSARDLGVVRARLEKMPVVLGSATPSLESLYNAQRGRYRHLSLTRRAAGATMPAVALIDLRRQPLRGGLSNTLLDAIYDTLRQQEQVLLFINRRGYAPAILCHECGWVAYCSRCSAPLTLHRAIGRLRCHHCGSERRIPQQCGEKSCGSPHLVPIGSGTEQVESFLREAIDASIPIQRVDRDAIRRKGALEDAIAQVHRGGPQILVGTQMLAKGHHFPNVTLVGILNADQGLFSVDFRSQERLLALVLQVAGRAGRAEKPGRVMIQTHHPAHPLMTAIQAMDYGGYARALLEERKAARLPPYTCVALLHAEAQQQEATLAFLREAAALLPIRALQVHGPMPSPMERRVGRYRSQLWLQSDRRQVLLHTLGPWVAALESLPSGRRVRWALDMDPLDLL